MPKWSVSVKEIKQEVVEVEADDWSGAYEAALAVELGPKCRTIKDADVLRQLGEPWVRGGWYDLHGPGDVIVCSPAHGNLFTEKQVAELRRRLGKLGLVVRGSWNGVGCSTVSFQCGGRIGIEPMTKEQEAVLLAPMPGKESK